MHIPLRNDFKNTGTNVPVFFASYMPARKTDLTGFAAVAASSARRFLPEPILRRFRQQFGSGCKMRDVVYCKKRVLRRK